MCYQKRLVYGGCNHSAPLGLASTCPHEGTCEGTRIHPLKTIRVEEMCPACRDKKVKVDNSLAAFAEKVRRLREELAKRGFGKDGEGCPGSGSGNTSASTDHGSRDEGEGKDSDGPMDGRVDGKGPSGALGQPAGHGTEEARGPGAGCVSKISADQTSSEKMATTVSDTVALRSLSPLTPARETPVKRNDMFVGGICLTSTSLTTIRGKQLL